ncbi:bifunctional metallophosphatase/5'-nucleotidase [Exiguobacterium flavidum]|uniref:bifunctional metallophosphatase/5'-nucleotidase n=1 Tax=Exiguobacterium flavidum TaxID=2184695 RepID=UPI000DF847D5|nr:5'-nucleotidase C-terminal domain-containing protein [Exiguobacterium flavidum]
MYKSKSFYAATIATALAVSVLPAGMSAEAHQQSKHQQVKEKHYKLSAIKLDDQTVVLNGTLDLPKTIEVEVKKGRVETKSITWEKPATDKEGTFVVKGYYTHDKKKFMVILKYKVVKKSEFNLSLMHTNDTHASLDNAPRRVTAIDEYRAAHPGALLIDAGDVFSGSLYFNEFKGQADLALMNLMEYDLMTFGNHEFDLGDKDGHAALAAFVKGAKFPFITANVDFSENDLFDGLQKKDVTKKAEDGKIYEGVIKEIDGEKVGFFGLTTEETKDISSPGTIAFKNYIDSAKRAVAKFEHHGVNKVVAVTHIGYDDNPAVDNDQLLAQYVDGIDIIIGGHSHTRLDAPVVVDKEEPTLIVQAYQYGDFLGTLDAKFDRTGKIIAHSGKLIDVKTKAPDAEAAALLKPYADKVNVLKNEQVGATVVNALPNPRTSDAGNTAGVSVRNSETALGNLITDAMLDKAKEYNAETSIAMQNGGGIRAAIPAGQLTVGQVLTTLPFGNTLATVSLTGAEVKELLELSVGVAPIENGGFLHVSGLKFTYDSSKAKGSRVGTVQVKTGAAYVELDLAKTYVVATNAFTAKGGDGLTTFEKAYKEGRVTDLGLSDWENLRDYAKKLGTIDYKIEGRIVDVKQ